MMVDHLRTADRPILDLLDAPYTFVNEALAKHYGIAGVTGNQMLKVELHPQHHRGGLLAMGHPIGPTGAGQIAEITRQLRGKAGVRQQPNARLGLAHMVGVGAVCVVHVLQKDP